MKNNLQFPTLRAEDIECRVQSVTPKGLILLLYKDARCDMRILDETVGKMGWQRGHESINGNLFCKVGIKDHETNEWIWKSDAGSPSNTEAEKGHASDSFKRACFNWGIGRELYTSPFIFIPIEKLENNELTTKKDKLTTTATFKPKVKEISYENGEIVKLIIENSKEKVIYSNYKKSKEKLTTNEPEQKEKSKVGKSIGQYVKIVTKDAERIESILFNKGYTAQEISKFIKYKFGCNLMDLTSDKYDEALIMAQRTIEKKAV